MRSSSSPYFSWTRSPQNRIFHLFIIAKHKHQDFTRCKSVNLILLGNQTSIFSGHGMHYLSGTWVVGGTAVAAARAMRPQLPRVELRLGSHHLSFSLGDMEVWWWVHYYHIHDYSLLLSSWWWLLLLLIIIIIYITLQTLPFKDNNGHVGYSMVKWWGVELRRYDTHRCVWKWSLQYPILWLFHWDMMINDWF